MLSQMVIIHHASLGYALALWIAGSYMYCGTIRYMEVSPVTTATLFIFSLCISSSPLAYNHV